MGEKELQFSYKRKKNYERNTGVKRWTIGI